MVKNPLANVGDTEMEVRSLGQEEGIATHTSILAWRTPGTGEPGGLPSMGSHRVRHN